MASATTNVVATSLALACLLGVLPWQAWAQPAKTPRVGVLRTSSRHTPDPAVDGLRRGLREVGLIEGQNIHLEYRWAEGRPERVPGLAVELVRLGVDVIVTGGEEAIRAAKQATGTIPIVMGASNDPVATGLVASLGRPGGNVTGMTVLAPELSRKRLELFKDVFPRATRVAVLSNPTYPGAARDLSETRSAAQQLGLAVQNIDVRSAGDFEAAAAAAARERVDGLIPLGDPFFTAHRARIVELSNKHRLPGVYYWKEFVEAGGLMSYGPNLADLYRRAASHVDKILKGARPAELPVEQPTTFELIVNLKTAQALALSIPQSVLIRADQVIR